MSSLRRWLTVLAVDVTAPALLTAVAAHELLYDKADALTWTLVLAIIWPLPARRRSPATVLAVCLAVGLALWADRICWNGTKPPVEEPVG